MLVTISRSVKPPRLPGARGAIRLRMFVLPVITPNDRLCRSSNRESPHHDDE